MAQTSQQDIAAEAKRQRRGRLRKTIRMIKLCRMLDAGGEYSRSQLAAMFHVTGDTITDNMDEIDVEAGIPIVKRREVEVYFRKMTEADIDGPFVDGLGRIWERRK
jgi:predicted DNA-binding transcriptional regulator YafY